MQTELDLEAGNQGTGPVLKGAQTSLETESDGENGVDWYCSQEKASPWAERILD